jgi:hypothetical protein
VSSSVRASVRTQSCESHFGDRHKNVRSVFPNGSQYSNVGSKVDEFAIRNNVPK